MEMTVLILRNGERATKKFTSDMLGISVEGYDSGFKFDATTPHLSGFWDMVGMLESLRKRRRAFVIRGRPTGPREDIPRRYKKEPQTIEMADRRWLMVDIDTAALTGDPVESALAALPERFSKARCWWNLSSSHGVIKKDVVKIHLWYMLDRPVCGRSIRRWIGDEGLDMDRAPFNPIQPHFIADPVFEGMDDPVEKRSGVHNAECGDLVLPDRVLNLEDEREHFRRERERRAEAVRKKREASSVDPSSSPGDVESKKRRYAKKALDQAVEGILSAVESTRHHTIYSESASIAELSPWLEVGWQDALIDAAYAVLPAGRAESEAERTVRDGIEAANQIRDLSFIESISPFEPRDTPSRDDHFQRAAVASGVKKSDLVEAVKKGGGCLPRASTAMYREFSELIGIDVKRMKNGGFERADRGAEGVSGEDRGDR